MIDKRKISREHFTSTADELIQAVISGDWDHVLPKWKSLPVESWDEVLVEFAYRCPGCNKHDYVDALRRSQWNDR